MVIFHSKNENLLTVIGLTFREGDLPKNRFPHPRFLLLFAFSSSFFLFFNTTRTVKPKKKDSLVHNNTEGGEQKREIGVFNLYVYISRSFSDFSSSNQS